ncbi:hypothetical protein [Sandarakinorhabdus cyanobacteriorum]|uniref:hypothetical protein n=1 Tax=Sandarakinorhabdus cyanobacteriorum TaxID=1981098 RepID=UPI0010559112|nr:hypothetical protein [Sandarakinorhabdus cyanobacteriorum]
MANQRYLTNPLVSMPELIDEPALSRALVAFCLEMKVTALNLWIHRGFLNEFEVKFGKQDRLSMRAALYFALMSRIIDVGIRPKEAAQHALWGVSSSFNEGNNVFDVDENEVFYFIFSSKKYYRLFKVNTSISEEDKSLTYLSKECGDPFIVVNLTAVFDKMLKDIHAKPNTVEKWRQYAEIFVDD